MALATVGAVAISGLPPLNGFASEWMLYLASFRTLGGGGAAVPVEAIAAVALAMIGALAVACFVKLVGATFLGSARSELAHHAHDPELAMIVPMAILAAGCLAIGLFPTAAAPLLERAARAWSPSPGLGAEPLGELAGLGWISSLGLVLVALAGGLALAAGARPGSVRVRSALTWDCGYAAPSPRMQYSSSSFADMLASLFAFVLWPKKRTPALVGPFPRGARFALRVPDTFLDRVILQVFRFASRHLPKLRVLQQGQTQWYVLYVLVTMIALLAWGSREVAP
jgi:hydrogenase-4 component B